MRLLSRTPPRFDEHLTYFTESDADAFRRLVGRSFAAAGRDVSVLSDRVVDRGGTSFSLWNIGMLCRGRERDDWQALVDDHVRLVATPARELTDLSPDELAAGVCLRLAEAATVPEPDGLAYARVVTTGLLEVLSVDLPDAVATPRRDELAAVGALGELLPRARENLRLLLRGDLVVERVVPGGAGGYTAVSGASPFTASLALLLAETVETLTGDGDWGRGTLAAVPSRHRLLYRPVDTADAGAALERMLDAAFDGFHSDQGRLSPDVFWVRGREWTALTSSDRGKPRILRGTGLRDALRGL